MCINEMDTFVRGLWLVEISESLFKVVFVFVFLLEKTKINGTDQMPDVTKQECRLQRVKFVHFYHQRSLAFNFEVTPFLKY